MLLVLQKQQCGQILVRFPHWYYFSIRSKQSQATSVRVMLINC